MPLYDFYCKNCLKRYEIIIKLANFEDKKKASCPHCGEKLQEIIHPPCFRVAAPII